MLDINVFCGGFETAWSHVSIKIQHIRPYKMKVSAWIFWFEFREQVGCLLWNTLSGRHPGPKCQIIKLATAIPFSLCYGDGMWKPKKQNGLGNCPPWGGINGSLVCSTFQPSMILAQLSTNPTTRIDLGPPLDDGLGYNDMGLYLYNPQQGCSDHEAFIALLGLRNNPQT